MKILILHPNMPGQYKHIARVLAEDKNNEVVFLTKPRPGVEIPGVRKVEYKVTREPKKQSHRYLITAERGIYAGQEVWRVCRDLQAQGFTPDVMVGHRGWGDGLYLKDAFPGVPLLSFMEFYYQAYGGEAEFDPEEPHLPDDKARIRTKNAVLNSNLIAADWCISPTIFQKQVHPKEFWGKISVIHDGVDTDICKPKKRKSYKLPNGVKLDPAKDEIITYIARNFEPYRGFPTFMHAVEIILKKRPNAHVIIVGNDGVSYGKKLPNGKTYKQQMLEEITIDEKRVHFLGRLPYDEMLKVMQISGAHIYLTYPFVLSWSMMEAMACECLMICSDTEPVREVIQNGKNGLLVDFFNPEDVAAKIDEVFNHEDRMLTLRKTARKTILARYAYKNLIDKHIAMITEMANGQVPPPTGLALLKNEPKT